MSSEEPLLTAEDRRLFALWERACRAHAATAVHLRRVERARRTVEEMAARRPEAVVAWSGGKDSTAMLHMVHAAGVPYAGAMSEKDDLDFPGEEAYVRGIASACGVRLDVLRPPFSVQEWLAAHPVDPRDDQHGRGAALSKAAFYEVVEAYHAARGRPGVYLGLRTAESRARNVNRAAHGVIYTKRNGETVCTPLADFADIDVYAYLFAHDIPLLDVYRCVRLDERPGRVRKSWWLPAGEAGRRGGMVWLRVYYPSLYRRLCELVGGASSLT